jgi:hypothetical protein
MEPSLWQIRSSEPVRTVQARPTIWQRHVMCCHSNSRKPRWIEQAHDGAGVGCRLSWIDIAAGSRHREHVEPRIEQRDREGYGVVDTWIDVENHLPRHRSALSGGMLTAAILLRGQAGIPLFCNPPNQGD